MDLSRRPRRAQRVRRAVATIAIATSALALGACGTASEPVAEPASSAPTTASSPATSATSAPAPAETSDALVPEACAGDLAVTSVGTVDAAAGAELSGMVASRAHPGVWWVHNDSGAGPLIHAIADDGRLLGSFDLGSPAVDWEAIAVAPDGDGWSLLVGDIGDNAESRPSVQVIRVAEPEVGPDQAASVTTSVPDAGIVTLTYPDRPHNAEAMLVDPDTGQLVIITKEITGPAHVFVADGEALEAGATVPLDAAGTVDLGGQALISWVTAADISPDGTLVAARTYGGVHLFARESGRSVADALAGTPCAAPPPLEAQGEAIAVDADGRSYRTVAEGETPILHRTGAVSG